MRLRTRSVSIRRAAAALALGIGGVAGVIGVTAGTAGAAAGGRIDVSSPTTPLVAGTTGTGQHAGNLVLAFQIGYVVTTTAETATLTLPSTVSWAAVPVVTGTGASTFVGTPAISATPHVLDLRLEVHAATTAVETVTLTTVSYTTASASGAIAVVFAASGITFNGSPVTNAYAGYVTARATAAPGVIGTGSAGDLTFTFPAGGETTAGTLTLTVPSGVKWEGGAITATSTSTSFASSPNFTTGTNTATVSLAAKTTTSTAKVLKIKTILYNVGTYSGTVTVTPTYSEAQVGFSPFAVPNAKAVVRGSTAGNSITATSKPSVPKSGTANAAGSLTIHLRGTAATASTSSDLILPVVATNGSGHVSYHSATTSSTGITAVQTAISHPTGTPSGTSTAQLDITLGDLAKTATATVNVTGIAYNTHTVQGTIKVTPKWHNTFTLISYADTYGTFTPSSAVNAVSSAAVPAAVPTIAVTKLSVPTIGVGTTGTAGSEKVTITGSTANNTHGWTAGASLTLTASRTGTCNATTTFLAFSGTPTVTYTATTSSGASTTPKVKATLASVSPCTTAGKDNELKITFTNTVTLKHTGPTPGKAIFIISGIKYAAGAADVHGAVSVATATSTFAASNPTPSGTPGNADIAYAYVSTKPVTTTPGAYDHATTTVKVVEAKGHTIPTGYLCLTLNKGTFNTSASASVKTTGGGTAGTTVSYKSTDLTALFDVTKASTATKPSTFTVSGLAVNAPSTTGGTTVTVTARDGETATCATTSGNATLVTTAVAATASPNVQTVLTTLHSTTQIYGATAAATAVKLLETSYTATAGHCPGTATTTNDNRPVVIATETHFQDALSAQYLASDLRTGVLLTSYGSLPTVTIQALKTEGVTQVDIVGGPLAVSTAVQKQLETLPAYTCGGTNELKTSGHVRFLSVTRIYGHTAEGTAQAIDSLIPSPHVASEAFVTAYVGVNANKGTGMYNTTAGLSSAPTTTSAVPTVIMASGSEFQDAMAASTLSYWRTASGKSLPIVLTSPTALTSNAAGALATTGAKQVILMGGQLAVANSVVTTLVSDGIEVLRIAGQNYTGTAAELAKFEYGTATHKGVGWTSPVVAVARGNGFTDGLVGAVVAGNTGANNYGASTTPEPLVLTLDPTTVGATLTAFLKAYGATGPAATNGKITSLQIFGGPLAVSPSVISQMQADIA